MKEVRENLYCWSEFSEAHQVDFNGFLLYLMEGNILVDPLLFSPEDEKDLRDLGPVASIIVTNSDHLRAAEQLSKELGVPVYAPAGEEGAFPCRVVRWLKDGDFVAPELQIFALEGSKTDGELAILFEEKTLITGDLIRSNEKGTLTLLADEKLKDKAKAVASVKRLAALPKLEALAVGDGGPVFEDAKARLSELLQSLEV